MVHIELSEGSLVAHVVHDMFYKTRFTGLSNYPPNYQYSCLKKNTSFEKRFPFTFQSKKSPTGPTERNPLT